MAESTGGKVASDYPYQSRLIGSNSAISGHETQDEAAANVADRNKRAEELGIVARYEAFAK
jgi:hypothetical protein